RGGGGGWWAVRGLPGGSTSPAALVSVSGIRRQGCYQTWGHPLLGVGIPPGEIILAKRITAWSAKGCQGFGWPRLASQTFTFPSKLPLTRRLPSALTATLLTACVCAVSVSVSAPVTASHTFT